MSIMNMLSALASGKPIKNKTLSPDEIAQLLHTDKAALAAFERAYAVAAMTREEETGYVNAKTASKNTVSGNTDADIINSIVSELVSQTQSWTYTRGKHAASGSEPCFSTQIAKQTETKLAASVSVDAINALPLESRPFLTGTAVVRDIKDDGYIMLLEDLKRMQTHPRPEIRRASYKNFRMGLDHLDLDPVIYEMLSCNRNSMSHWLPAIAEAVDACENAFFKIPDTTIVKVPLPVLQLSRIEYSMLNRTTLDIIDAWAREAFKLDETRKYFIKTGTFSSKFDFRNAKVTDPKEIREIGEYLLYIQYSAGLMPYYGVNTTNEWVVREFIEDENDEPTIYHGLPLHTEYRVFVDFDRNELFGVHNYWDPDVMLNHFMRAAVESDGSNPESVNAKHDYLTYAAHKDTLTGRFEANKDLVAQHIRKIMPNVKLTGQWSIDIMQNGDSFWIIDMALAEQSSFYAQEVPASKRIPESENAEDWIPKLT